MAKQPFENVVLHLFQIAAQAEFKTLNDQELLKRYVELKDQLAFGELIRRYKLMIWSVCWHVLRQHQDVEDAFQATIMTLLRRAKTVLGRATIEGWMHKTAFKVASNARVIRERRHAREERRAAMRKESFENDHFKWELGELIDKELIRIPEKFRNPLILCYLKGLTQKQAAQQLGISVDNLEWRLHQGRERLQKNLAKHGLDLGSTIPMAELALGAHVPEMPSGVVNKTLEMVRIMTLSNGVLETAGISPQVVALVKGAMGIWTLKAKICLGILLLTLASVGAGVARYPSFFLNLMGWEQPRERKPDPINQVVREPQASKVLPQADLYGDPLPTGSLARLGTVRFRNENSLRFRGRSKVGEIVFTPDSQAIGVLEIGKVPCLWNMKSGEPVRPFEDGLRGGYQAGSWLSLDGRRLAYKQIEGGVYKLCVREVATGKLIRTFEVAETRKASRLESVCCCALSPDGKTLGYFSGKLRLMDIATGQQIWEQKMDIKDTNNIRIIQLLFSPDGSKVAVVCNRTKKSSIELRDVRTGKRLRTLGHPWVFAGYSDCFSFSPDGRSLLVAYGKGSVHLWDVDRGTEHWHLNDEKHIYSRPAFSPDGKMIALHDCLKCGIPEIALYEVATGKKVGFCYYPDGSPEGVDHNTAGNLLTFSPNGKVLVSMPGDCPLITCWDVATGKILTLPPFGHEAAVQSVAFAPDGKTLFSKGKNQAVHVWDSFTGRKERTLIEESSLRSAYSYIDISDSTPASVVSSADGKILASTHYLPLDEKKISSAPSSASLVVLVGLLNARIRPDIGIWDATTGRELRRIRLNPRLNGQPLLHELAISPDGKFLAAEIVSNINNVSCVLLWEVDTGKQIVNVKGANPTFSPDSTLLMTHKDHEFCFWDTSTGKKAAAVNTEMRLEKQPIKVTPDWQTIVGITCHSVDKWTKKCRWSINPLYQNKQSKKVVLRRPSYFDTAMNIRCPSCLAVSRDGKMLAWAHGSDSGSRRLDGTIHLIETTTGMERACFKGHFGNINSLCFSPDGRRLASGSDDTTVLVWDVTGGYLDERGHLRSAWLTKQQLQQLWIDLASTNAVQAGRAIWTLVGTPKQTVPFFAKRLSPIPIDQALPQRIARLIKELDHEQYPVRHKAEVELAKLGEAAEDGIRQALEERPSAEVRLRLKQLLRAIEQGRDNVGPTGDVLRGIRSIEILERIGTPQARRILETLSQGAPGARLTREAQAALNRLR